MVHPGPKADQWVHEGKVPPKHTLPRIAHWRTAMPCEVVRKRAVAEDHEPIYSSKEQFVRHYAKVWSRADQEKLAKIDEFDTGQLPSAIKEQLLGTWKLFAASDADCVSTAGLTGLAVGSHASVISHFQTFSKPDPRDVLTGGVRDKFFMETREVIADVKAGTTTTVSLKGGFYVGQLADTPLGVSERYSRLEVDGVKQPGAEVVNRWDCTFLSDSVRVCRAVDGSLRVYEKVATEAALAELASLGRTAVNMEPAAAMAGAEAERVAEDDLAVVAAQEHALDERLRHLLGGEGMRVTDLTRADGTSNA